MKVVWTEQALLRLAEIEDYIWANNPAAAVAHTERLIDRAETLGENPRIGRVVPELPGGPLRELIDGKYRIVYRLRGEQVEIVTVFEGHRLFPTDDLPEQSEE